MNKLLCKEISMDKNTVNLLENTNKKAFQELFQKKYGFIKRARLSFLYTEKNIRLLDLAQDEGRAILGWRHGSSMLAFKNTLEKGLWASYPSGEEIRLKKAIKTLFAHCGLEEFAFVSWYQNLPETFLTKEIPAIYPWSGLSPLDELDSKRDALKNQKEFLFYPPLPWPSLCIIASKENNLPLSQPLSTSLIEALSRSVYDLIKAFPQRPLWSWGKFDAVLDRYFIREGSVLKPKLLGKDYDSFAIHCLESEIYIPLRNPNTKLAPPSFVPWHAELSSLKKL